MINYSISRSHFLDCLDESAKNISEKENLLEIEIRQLGDQDEIQTFSGGEIIGYRRCPYFYCPREKWNYQAGLDQALEYCLFRRIRTPIPVFSGQAFRFLTDTYYFPNPLFF